MSTGYEITEHDKTITGKAWDELTWVTLSAPTGKRIVAHEVWKRDGVGYRRHASGTVPSALNSDGSSIDVPVYDSGEFRLRLVCVNADVVTASRLAAPAALRAKVNANRTVQLDWQAVAGASGGYRIYERVMSPNGVAVVTAVTSTRGPLAPGPYEYFVRAIDADGRESADSVHAVVTV